MSTSTQVIFRTPFSAAYWRCAAQDLRKPRVLAFSALMVAASIALSQLSIPVHESLKITFGFLARALCALVGGPVTALVFGFVEDNLSFFLRPTGAYFPGYTLTTMLGTMIYALFFYRTRVTVLRIFLAKLSTNVLNVILGSVWSAILFSKGYLYYASTSLVKNAILLPLQTLLLVLLFGALLPVMRKAGLLPAQEQNRLPIF